MTFGFVLGILAAFVWSITNLIDKYLVSRYSSDGNIGGVLLLSCLFPFFLLCIALFFSTSIFNITTFEKEVLIFSGVLMVAWIYFYLKALSEDDASVVMTMLVLAPLFSLIFAAMILHEWPTTLQLLSGTLIILGAFTVSYEPHSGSFKWLLMAYAVSAAAVTGLMHTLFKFATVTDSFWESIFWRSFGMVTIGSLLYIFVRSYRNHFHSFLREHFGSGMTLNASNESLTLIGDTIFAFAILFAPLALIQTTEAYQPVFILILVFVLSRAGFGFVTEKADKRKMLLRILGIVLALIGGVMLSITS